MSLRVTMPRQQTDTVQAPDGALSVLVCVVLRKCCGPGGRYDRLLLAYSSRDWKSTFRVQVWSV